MYCPDCQSDALHLRHEDGREYDYSTGVQEELVYTDPDGFSSPWLGSDEPWVWCPECGGEFEADSGELFADHGTITRETDEAIHAVFSSAERSVSPAGNTLTLDDCVDGSDGCSGNVVWRRLIGETPTGTYGRSFACCDAHWNTEPATDSHTDGGASNWGQK
jgi:hypothetical protein